MKKLENERHKNTVDGMAKMYDSVTRMDVQSHHYALKLLDRMSSGPSHLAITDGN